MKYPAPTSIAKEIAVDIPALKTHITEQVRWLRKKSSGIRETLLPRWIKTYKGIPESEKKSFPWVNASNIIITLAATHADELLSRVMAIYAQEELFAMQIYGDYGDSSGEDERNALEYFLSDIAFEPTELDLYRVEETWFSSAIRYGTGICHIPWQKIVEKQCVYMPGISADGKKFHFQDITITEGPTPENVPLNKFMTDPQISILAKSPFVVRIDTMHWHDLRKWRNEEMYDWIDQQALEVMISQPDRMGPAEAQEQQEETKKMEAGDNRASTEWDMYECHIKWDASNGNSYSLICFYHLHSDTYLGGIFNMYPMNELPIEDCKLAYDDDTYYGYGLMEMLEMYQREISTNHNQRIDNRNLTNTGVGRINPGSKLASILKIYPGALFPANKDEVEPLAFGAPNANLSTEDEQLTMQYAAARAGVDPSMGGQGGGTVNAKKGNYSAGGTAIVQQQRDNRNNLRMSDMRAAHARLGRKVLKMYAAYGVDSKVKRYGDKAELIIRGLRDFKEDKLGLMVRPVTASINREMEKQNDILLQQTMERLQAGDLQMLQAITGPAAQQPQLQQYMADVMYGKNALMKQLLMAFNKRDIDRLAPLPDIVKEIRDAARKAKAGASSASGGGVPKPNGSSQQAGSVLPGARGNSTPQLPSSSSGGSSTGTPLPTAADGGVPS